MNDAERAETSAAVTITLDGRPLRVDSSISVAAALLGAGARTVRRSVTGAERAPLCGMGTCHECRVTIDDVPHRRSCLVTVFEGMRVTTSADA